MLIKFCTDSGSASGACGFSPLFSVFLNITLALRLVETSYGAIGDQAMVMGCDGDDDNGDDDDGDNKED